LVTEPVLPPMIRTPTLSLTPLVDRVPRLVTLLLLSRVTSAPGVVGLIEPSAVILMSSAAVPYERHPIETGATNSGHDAAKLR
jgi:hypothetical protein